MVETWIKPNRRVLAVGLIVPALLFAAAVGSFAVGQLQGSWVWSILALFLGVAAGLFLAVLLRLIRQPRVALQDGELLIYGGLTDPIRVPIDVVECFFLGQAGGMIPDVSGREAEVRTVIIRIAESATDWHHRDVKAALVHWCEGYITIRGTWCEPITPELMKQLNHRLATLHRQRRQRAAEAVR